jgi:hypothetical protein
MEGDRISVDTLLTAKNIASKLKGTLPKKRGS